MTDSATFVILKRPCDLSNLVAVNAGATGMQLTFYWSTSRMLCYVLLTVRRCLTMEMLQGRLSLRRVLFVDYGLLLGTIVPLLACV